MDRRELLHLVGSAALTPALSALPAERRLEIARAIHARLTAAPLKFLKPEQAALVTKIGEMILPATDTPGATDAKVTEFADLLLDGWYDFEEQQRFVAGLAAIDTEARGEGGSIFVESTPEVQVALLTRWDGARGEPESATAQFARLKSLTLYGYFTSELVNKEVTKTRIIPGRFEGCIPVVPGGGR